MLALGLTDSTARLEARGALAAAPVKSLNPLLDLPAERFELPTNGLQNRCSTTELIRHCNNLPISGANEIPISAHETIHAELIPEG